MKIYIYKEFIGETIKQVYYDKDGTYVIFKFESGNGLLMEHEQDCCEYVDLDDVVGGKLEELVGQKILNFEEVINRDLDEKPLKLNIDTVDTDDNSFTWSFYKISTIKDDITLRWFGTSNGYYSEEIKVSKLDSKEIEFHIDTYVNGLWSKYN